ncbi:MAG: hypothetical protein WCL27_11805 [Betaproteobacteria bacterium]
MKFPGAIELLESLPQPIHLPLTLSMTAKPKPPASMIPKPKASPPRKSTPPSLPQADSRWQRTVRYGWDKGGAKGGR